MDTKSYLQNLVKLGVIKRPEGRPAAVKEVNFKFRITKAQLERLDRYAQERGLSMSEVMRNYINRLPTSKSDE